MTAFRRVFTTMGIVVVLSSLSGVAVAGPLGSSSGSSRASIASELYIDAAVRDALLRPATAADMERWARPLDLGATRSAVVADILNQPEWYRSVVAYLYDSILYRDPDPSGLTYWSGRLARGLPTASLAAALFGSNEYYDGAGGTPERYVTVVYVAVLGRQPDAAGRDYWVRRIESGESRAVIAKSFWLTTETNARRVDDLHLRFLGRLPDEFARVVWSRRLVASDDKELAAALLAGDEYYRRSQQRVG